MKVFIRFKLVALLLVCSQFCFQLKTEAAVNNDLYAEPCVNEKWTRVGNVVSNSDLTRGICLGRSVDSNEEKYQFSVFRGMISDPISGLLTKQQLIRLDFLLEKRVAELGLTAINDVSLRGKKGIQLFVKFLNTVNSPVNRDNKIYNESELLLLELMLQLTVSWNPTDEVQVVKTQHLGSVISEVTHQVIGYTQKHDEIVFSLASLNDPVKDEKISSLNNLQTTAYKLAASRWTSNMQMTKSLFHATRVSYKWCFSDNLYHDNTIEFIPAFFLFIFTPVMLPLCGTLPGVPFIVGVALSPLDFIYGTIHQSIKNRFNLRANRAFKRMMKGERVIVGEQTFAVLLEKIKAMKVVVKPKTTGANP
jgi:hypothetical protein